MQTLQSIKYEKGKLEILNQLLLPAQTVYESIETIQNAYDAIQQMKVRGAPAIAIVALLSIAVEMQDIEKLLHSGHFRRPTKLDLRQYLRSSCDHLCSARPTAVHIRRESDRFLEYFETLLEDHSIEFQHTVDLLEHYLSGLLERDRRTNESIGSFGSGHILNSGRPADHKFNVLTICNTGSLATSGYGTALGVVRSLNKVGRLNRCYFVETRPYLQGARLTAVELLHDQIPATLLCDSMISPLMRREQIDAVVVGVDRLTANGDFANKIGTQQMALLAKHYSVPFYVACPLQSIDWTIESGTEIPIEQRPAKEMQFIGGVQIAPTGTYYEPKIKAELYLVIIYFILFIFYYDLQKLIVGIRLLM